MAYVAAETVDTLVRLVREQSTELARVRVELAGLRAEVRALAQAEADDDQAELIEAAHAACGESAFIAVDLLTTAAGSEPAGVRLAALLSDKTPRSIGRDLLAACGKRTPGGLVLRRVGDCKTGAIWCITRAGLKPANPP